MSELIKLKNKIESNNEKLETLLVVDCIRVLYLNFKIIKSKHPKINYAYFGMGSYSIDGFFTVKYFDGFDNAANWTTNDVDAHNVLCHFKPSYFDFEKRKVDGATDWTGLTDGIEEFYEAAETIVKYKLTTCFDVISEKGVGFTASWRNKEDVLNSFKCQLLMKANIPMFFKG